MTEPLGTATSVARNFHSIITEHMVRREHGRWSIRMPERRVALMTCVTFTQLVLSATEIRGLGVLEQLVHGMAGEGHLSLEPEGNKLEFSNRLSLEF